MISNIQLIEQYPIIWQLMTQNSQSSSIPKTIDIKRTCHSNHELNIVVDFLAAVAPVTIITHWFPDAGGQGALGGGQLEGEHEFSDPLELASHVYYLVYDVLEADDLSSDVLFHLRVWFDVDSLLPYFAEEFLVDQFADQLFGGFSPGDVVLYLFQLPDGGGRTFEEDSSVDLSKVEFGEDDGLLPWDVSDASQSDH